MLPFSNTPFFGGRRHEQGQFAVNHGIYVFPCFRISKTRANYSFFYHSTLFMLSLPVTGHMVQILLYCSASQLAIVHLVKCVNKIWCLQRMANSKVAWTNKQHITHLEAFPRNWQSPHPHPPASSVSLRSFVKFCPFPGDQWQPNVRNDVT